MIKSVTKIIVFLMGIQSLLGNLEKQGIISGSIKINYPVLQDKIISLVKSDEFQGLVKKAQTSEITNYVTPNEAYGAEPPANNYYNEQENEYRDEYNNERDTNYRIERYDNQSSYPNSNEHRINECSNRRIEYRSSESRLRNIRCVRHVVRAGETLSDLAEVYGVSWKVIKRANYIYNERCLQVGQNLIIPIRTNNFG